MGIDPAPFWANLYLYQYENLFMMKPIEQIATKGLSLRMHFDSLMMLVLSMIQMPFMNLIRRYTHLNFNLNLNIVAIMLHFWNLTSPLWTVYLCTSCLIRGMRSLGSIMSEILRIARSTLHYGDFIPRTTNLFERIINQGAAASKLSKQIDKVVK